MNNFELNKKSLIKNADLILKKLFPICRSITGEGLRETLYELKNITDFKIIEVPSREKYYDWEIPLEWNIREAYIKNSKGVKIINFKDSNLHVMNYSSPINAELSFDQLKDHLYTLPELPNAIPYRTTYYNNKWGFCLSQNQYNKLKKDEIYRVYIDSSFSEGWLTIGEKSLEGSEKNNTYLFSTYPCHPSLGNDNLSGIVLWTLLLKELKNKKLKNNYRFVIHPETIGAITYLSKNEKEMLKIDGGFVISTVAGPGKIGYKKTFLENSIIDVATKLTLKENNIDYLEYDFDADEGSDERQYSSPFFSIPMATICKDKYFEYKYYHTSLDNLDFISGDSLVDTLDIYLKVIDKLEKNHIYKSLNPKCEPMLGKRGLYPKTGGQLKQSVSISDQSSVHWNSKLKAINWLMYLSDGSRSLVEITNKIKINFDTLYENAVLLEQNGLLKKIK